jgi:hypothetical protein
MNGGFENDSVMESRAWSLGPLSQNVSHIVLSKNLSLSINKTIDERMLPYVKHSREGSIKNFSFLARNNI